ncbi:hypothetical protein [Microcoleus phage My-WqHQDG]|nr:hypothetical protein [Microcoleus phage My-WqHQDG]
MLEFYIQSRKRWKNRSLNKRRRALLNGMSSEGEPLWDGPYIAAIRGDEWYRRDKLSPFKRYLRRQVGKYAPDVYSDLSHCPIYRQSKYLLKEAFMREMQWEWEYRRDWDEFIETVPPLNTNKPPLELRAYDTGFEGKWFAKYLVWYPYRRGKNVVIDKGAPPITGYLCGVGWYGYYTKTEKVYEQELLLDAQARPLFTKQEYEIHTKGGEKRVIPVGGPLLRETMTTTTRSEWKYMGDSWDMRAYAGSVEELQQLRKMLVYP